MSAQLSVIILHYNRHEQLRRLVERIPPNCQIVIADDGSDVVPRFDDDRRVVVYTHPKEGIRAATCRNAGAALAMSDKLLFLDDDVIPHPLLFHAHALALEMYDVSLGLLTREEGRPYSDPRAHIYVDMERRAWRFCLSGNLAITRRAFQEAGGFDPLYDGAHGWEDLDLGLRLQNLNKRFIFNYLAVAHHPSEHLAFRDPERVAVNRRKFIERWGEIV